MQQKMLSNEQSPLGKLPKTSLGGGAALILQPSAKKWGPPPNFYQKVMDPPLNYIIML